jgi:hypothetical protein
MTTVTIDIKGLDAVLGKLDRLTPEVQAAAKQGLFAVAQIAANDAKLRVARGPKTGRIYKRGKIAHQASAPGEAPATDLGKLLGSIRGELANEPLTANLVASVDYAIHLEFGTSKMAPRPFMRPAADLAAAQGAGIIASYVQDAMGGSGAPRWTRGVSLTPLVGVR